MLPKMTKRLSFQLALGTQNFNISCSTNNNRSNGQSSSSSKKKVPHFLVRASWSIVLWFQDHQLLVLLTNLRTKKSRLVKKINNCKK